MNTVLVLVILYNVIVIGSIGLYLARKEKESGDVTDMATGGRNANLALFSVTLGITYLGSAHVYGLMEMSFALGAVVLWFSFAHTILMCVICLGTGQWVRRLGCATIPEFAELGPKLAGATLVVTLFPTWLVVLVQAGFLGALLSTFAMSALAPATIFAKDIVGANIKGGLTLIEEKKLIQRVILIIGCLAAALTFFNHPNVIRGITWLFAWLAPLFFITVAGLFWKRSSTAAFTVVIWSWLINCAWSIGPIKQMIVEAIPGSAVLENAHITAIVAFTLTILLYGFAKTSKPALFSKAYSTEQSVRGEVL